MPWDVKKRDCKQKSTGKKGTHVVVKKNRDGSTEQESCHTSDSKAQGARRARYASKNESVLREWIRASLTEGLLTENRGEAYEKTIVVGMKNIPGVELGPPAGNNNSISDLGITFYGVDIAAEVKLNSDANLGAVSKDSIKTMKFVGGKVEYEIKSDPEHQANKEVIDASIANLNAGGLDGLQRLFDALTKGQPVPLVDELPLQGSAWSKQVPEAALEFSEKWKVDPDGMASWITQDMKADIAYRVLRDEKRAKQQLANIDSAKSIEKLKKDKKTRAQRVAELQRAITNLYLTDEHVAAGFKTISQVLPGLGKTVLNAPVLTAELLRTIMTRKKGPNGADTNYLITGNDDPSSFSGEIHHIGTDVLGIGTPLFDPGVVRLEVRFQGGGSGGKGEASFNLAFKTKADDKGPAGIPFNSVEELAAILANSRVAKSSKEKTDYTDRGLTGRLNDEPDDDSLAYPGAYDVSATRSLADSLIRNILKRLLQESQKNQH